ncbi:MAG: hypothetical protein JXR48_05060 [Candidatus Delongbacteria bacterium]|nr:hypothetical protein [Candidatus Delongbacteria bacterium]MBN2834318.1 hypothetical protein [Candidatus Delongbacteria bacterium]
MQKGLILYLFIYSLVTILLSFFTIGARIYSDGIIYGLINDQSTTPALVAGLLLFINDNHKKTHPNSLLIGITTVLLVLTMKRTPLIILGLFILARFIISNRNNKRTLIVMTTLLLFTLAWLFNKSLINFEREKMYTMDVEKEGRFLEIPIVFENISNNKITYFFGDGEMFFTVGKYILGNHHDRPLHTFYGMLMQGAGMFGLFFYCGILVFNLLLNIVTLLKTMNKYAFYIVVMDVILIVVSFVSPLTYVSFFGCLFIFYSFFKILFIKDLKYNKLLRVNNS